MTGREVEALDRPRSKLAAFYPATSHGTPVGDRVNAWYNGGTGRRVFTQTDAKIPGTGEWPHDALVGLAVQSEGLSQ